MRDAQKAFFIAGVVMFALAFVPMGILPWLQAREIPMKSIRELTQKVSIDFEDLAKRWPQAFKKYFGKPTSESYAKALDLGRNTYIAEACWHCHTQQVRPVANERLRFGEVSTWAEYENDLHLPHLFGTRRVGPDLVRESGKHTNDWHAAHFWNPSDVVPSSVMPRYKWFFDEIEGKVPQPNARGLAIIAYMQWLGSWPVTPPKSAPKKLAAKRGNR